MVTVQVCLTLPEAELIRARLEEAGIETYLPDQLAAERDLPLIQASGGIRIQVRDSDEDRANLVLNEENQD